MWETVVVGLIVALAVAYALWALLPAMLRLRLAQRLAAWGRRPGRAPWLTRASTAVERAARARLGACSDCGAVQDAPRAPSSKRPSPD